MSTLVDAISALAMTLRAHACTNGAADPLLDLSTAGGIIYYLSSATVVFHQGPSSSEHRHPRMPDERRPPRKTHSFFFPIRSSDGVRVQALGVLVQD